MNSPARLALRFTTLAVLATSFACSSPTNSGYLDDFSRLRDGEHVDSVWCSDPAEFGSAIAAVRVRSIEGRGLVDHTDLTAADAVDFLRRELVLAGSAQGGNDVLLEFPRTGATVTLEVVLSEMNPGSSSVRFWWGLFGAGHAYVQVETKLLDASGQVICELVQRTRASGSLGFDDTFGNPSAQIVKEMLRDAARMLRKELQGQLGS